MQGKKNYQEKLFTTFQLSNRVSESNFYRHLQQVVDLDKKPLKEAKINLVF